MNKIWKFPAMLGPPEEFPVGSIEWAERIAHRLQIHVGRVQQNEAREVKYIPPVLDAILDAKPRPWIVWPQDNPCRTPEAWFQTVTGDRIDSIVKLIEAYDPDSPLIRKLQVAAAEDAPAVPYGGDRRSETIQVAMRHLNEESSTSTARILARLARDRPDLLAEYKAGAFPSARAAAIEAGFIKTPSPLEQLRKAWLKASDDDRREFLNEIVVRNSEAAE